MVGPVGRDHCLQAQAPLIIFRRGKKFGKSKALKDRYVLSFNGVWVALYTNVFVSFIVIDFISWQNTKYMAVSRRDRITLTVRGLR